MFTIGALAQLAATSPRAIRHYHAVGVLPEPSRAANGYRRYDLRDAVLLVRIRRLVDLGLSLAQVRDAVQGEDTADEAGLRAALVELDADLAAQEQVIHQRRRHLATLLQHQAALAASEKLAAALAHISAAAPTAGAHQVARERQVLELIEAGNEPQRFARFAERSRTALADPAIAAAAQALAARFEALAHADPHDPQVEALAGDMVAALSALPAHDGHDLSWRPAWQAARATLPPAQQRCMDLVLKDGSR